MYETREIAGFGREFIGMSHLSVFPGETHHAELRSQVLFPSNSRIFQSNRVVFARIASKTPSFTPPSSAVPCVGGQSSAIWRYFFEKLAISRLFLRFSQHFKENLLLQALLSAKFAGNEVFSWQLRDFSAFFPRSTRTGWIPCENRRFPRRKRDCGWSSWRNGCEF